ncbi:MAG: hypothetical protein WDN00_18875 [Limisphaerales bacterium]
MFISAAPGGAAKNLLQIICRTGQNLFLRETKVIGICFKPISNFRFGIFAICKAASSSHRANCSTINMSKVNACYKCWFYVRKGQLIDGGMMAAKRKIIAG